MRFQKHVLGFIVFVIILTCIFSIYEYLYGPVGYGPFLKAPRAEPPATVTEPLAEPAAVDYDVRLVSLDFINGKSYTTLVIKLRPGQPAPEKLLVETYFYLPNGAKNQGRPLRANIQVPPAAGDRVEVTAEAECDWCASPDAPRAGYFADVFVAARYDGSLPTPSSGPPVEAAVPVVVQAERKPKS